MMPTLKIIEEANAATETIAVATQEEVVEEPKVFFEISSSVDQIPTTSFQFVEVNETVEMPKVVKITVAQEEKSELKIQQETENKSNLSSGSFLTKPTQIYAEEKPAIQESNTTEEPLPVKQSIQEDEPVVELQLVVKESTNVAEESVAQPTQPIMKSPVEETALQDETEELRRRANERLAKLRNLSFNVNAADPNNEFETVPAYLRRNMEMQVQLAEVENFYSNYTVKPNENNQADISTINTFLDGKKPD
jgi:cell division protein FtsZ